MSILVAPINRDTWVRRGLLLQYISLGYNCLEALVALVAGVIAGSIALVSFGFDSVIEVTSSATLLWRLNSDFDQKQRQHAETISLRIVGICFMGLAVYISYEATGDLWHRNAPEGSIAGIILASVSMVIMPLLAQAKRKVARAIESGALKAEARQTEFCAYLSVILLGGLLLNKILGWWWADPVAAMIMVPIIAREGWKALRGKPCDCSHNFPW
ncbi:MAG TPA: cation transporter [Terriglobia bacterium]|nr:cation transporter [Terriglobia bacterium]